jgi:hypothetical protein
VCLASQSRRIAVPDTWVLKSGYSIQGTGVSGRCAYTQDRKSRHGILRQMECVLVVQPNAWQESSTLGRFRFEFRLARGGKHLIQRHLIFEYARQPPIGFVPRDHESWRGADRVVAARVDLAIGSYYGDVRNIQASSTHSCQLRSLAPILYPSQR